jgi:group II intron reverse transcriptase/maturase
MILLERSVEMGKTVASLVRAWKARRTSHEKESGKAAGGGSARSASQTAKAVTTNRIAKAVTPNRTAKAVTANNLQGIWAMDHLRRAWRKVKANGGGPGVDGESLRTFEADLRNNLGDLQASLRSGHYQPQPVRRVWVPKPSGGSRPLAILTLRDRIVQRAVYDALAPMYEKKFLDCSFGFREGRSTRDAVAAIVRWRDEGQRWVVDGDIKDCFENLDRRLLMTLVRRDVKDQQVLKLIEAWLQAQVFNDLSGRDPAAGTFQGGVLSPLLANVYLHEFDQTMTRAGQKLARYADDWVILCARKSEAREALEAASAALERLRLAVNPYKTRVVNFDQGFSFVGVFFVRNEFYPLSPGVKRGV